MRVFRRGQSNHWGRRGRGGGSNGEGQAAWVPPPLTAGTRWEGRWIIECAEEMEINDFRFNTIRRKGFLRARRDQKLYQEMA